MKKRSEIEHVLEFEKKKYHHLFEQSPFSIILFNKYGKIIDCNSTTSKLTGLQKEDFLGKRTPQLIKEFKLFLGICAILLNPIVKTSNFSNSPINSGNISILFL